MHSSTTFSSLTPTSPSNTRDQIVLQTLEGHVLPLLPTAPLFFHNIHLKLTYAPKKKFQTKKERYKYLSQLFSGDGNPMHGVHMFGRTYTAERNKKVSEAVTIWAASHPEHYKEMGIKGALKAREKGLGGLPTKLEKAMENALKKNNIRYVPQYPFNIGIMDFYLPDAKIALFVDGAIWHADPRVYKAEDVLFFSRKISGNALSSKLTAKEVWLKDRRHNAYLKKSGFVVMRFWEKEIKANIQTCIQAIRLKLSRPKK